MPAADPDTETARPKGGSRVTNLEWGVDKECTPTAISWDEFDSHISKWPLLATTEDTTSRDAASAEASSSQDAGRESFGTAGTTHSPPRPHNLLVVQGELTETEYDKLLCVCFVFGYIDIEFLDFFRAHWKGKHQQWRAGVGKKAKPPSVTATYLIPRYSIISGHPQTLYFRASAWESAHISLLLLDDEPYSSTQDALIDIINGTVQKNAASIATGMVPGVVAPLAHRECLLYLDMATDKDDQQVTHVHRDSKRYKDIAWVLEHNLVASRLHEKAIRRTFQDGGATSGASRPPPEYESLDTVSTDDWKELIARLDRMVRLATLVASETSRGKDLLDRVSYMGGFLLPLSIIAGIMSMADPYRPGSSQFWLYWAIAIPVVCLCLIIIHADDIRNIDYYLLLNDQQIEEEVQSGRALQLARKDPFCIAKQQLSEEKAEPRTQIQPDDSTPGAISFLKRAPKQLWRLLPQNLVGWLHPPQRQTTTDEHKVADQPMTVVRRRHVTGRTVSTPGNPPIVLQMEANGKRKIYRREKLGWGGALKIILGFDTLPQE